MTEERGRYLSKICFGCEPLGGVDWGRVDISEISEAIDVAVERGKKWDYAAGMLRKMKDEHNVLTIDDYNKSKKKGTNKKAKIDDDDRKALLLGG